MTDNQLKEIMEDNFKMFGWQTWKNKSSIIFALKSKYGSIFDTKKAELIYDDIFDRENKKIKQEEQGEN